MTPLPPAPPASSPAVRGRMQRMSHKRDTQPELALRSAAHRLGLRFRVDVPVLPRSRRKADLAFPAARVAVFLDGCFWHGCPDHGTIPRTNSSYWSAKLAGNRRRDADTDEQLRAVGWLPVRVWEHEDPAAAAQRLWNLVLHRRAGARRCGDRGTER